MLRMSPILEIFHLVSSFLSPYPLMEVVRICKKSMASFWKPENHHSKSVLPFPVKTTFTLPFSFIFFNVFIVNLWIKCFVIFRLFSFSLTIMGLWKLQKVHLWQKSQQRPQHTVLYLYTEIKQCGQLCFSMVMWSLRISRMNSYTPSVLSQARSSSPCFISLCTSALGQASCVYAQNSHTYSKRSHSWDLVLCPPILKFLRTLSMDFYLVKEVRWDSALCSQDWSLAHTWSSYSGWILGPAPSSLHSSLRGPGLGQDPISAPAPWLLVPLACGSSQG